MKQDKTPLNLIGLENKPDFFSEMYKRFKKMQGELDEFEQVVGTPDPVNYIKNLYDAFDNSYDDINAFIAKDQQ